MDKTTTVAQECSTKTPVSSSLRRLLFGVGSSGVSQVIAAAQPIFLVPLFLRAWGAEGYGRWLVLTALVSYLSMLDLGGQNYIGNLLAIDHAQGNKDAFREKLSEGVSLFVSIALVVLIILIILLFGLMSSGVPVLGQALSAKERWIILFLGLNFLSSIPAGVYVSAYRASGLFVRGTMLGNGLRVFHFAVSTGLLYFSISPFVYALVFFIAGVVGTIVIVWDSRRVMMACRHIRIGLAEAKRGRKYLRGALQFWLLALSNGLNQQGVLLTLALFASPAIVALYATHRTAAGLIGYVGTVLQAPLWPELSFLWAQDRREELHKVLLLAIRLVMLFSGVAALLMWVLLPFIYPVWTGKQLQLQPVLFAIFLVQGALAAGWLTSGWCLLAANQHRILARWSLANAAVTIMLSFLLAPKHGALGVAVATLSGDMLCGLLIYPKLVANTMRFNVWDVYRPMFLAMFLLCILVLIALAGAKLMHGWQYCIFLLLALAIWSIPALFVSLGPEFRNRLLLMFRLDHCE